MSSLRRMENHTERLQALCHHCHEAATGRHDLLYSFSCSASSPFRPFPSHSYLTSDPPYHPDIFAGVLCVGSLKHARQRKEEERLRALQDLEDLERRRLELRGLLSLGE